MRFATGLLLGGVLGMVGAGFAMQDKAVRRKMLREGKQMVEKAGDLVEDATEKLNL